MLEKINKPNDVRLLDEDSLGELCTDIREQIIDAVSKNGGHLASNLGLVETTVALHRVLSLPEDKIIFDVGHQCYTHKLLTGRKELFSTLRKKDGISGFTSRFENECDTLTAGHSGTSVSAGLGIAKANKQQGKDSFVVSVVGDGSFTNGMIYEALNNCCDKNVNFIIVLNDNEMSISPNVGNMANHFSKIRTSKSYFSFKKKLKKVLRKVPVLGEGLISFSGGVKNFLKRVLIPGDGFFSSMGIRFLGPVDGHDIDKLCDVFEEAKNYHECCIVLVKTKKGKGYAPAEEHPESYHSVGKLSNNASAAVKKKLTFSDVFGECMIDKAKNDDKLCVLTAAMCEGTGLLDYSNRFPERFFDVGIAEEHEITFASGLAAGGMKPVCAVYSTFAQRVYDQVMHDVSIQKLGLTLALDRAGFVPDDGITHQGLYDVALFSSIPDVNIYSPETYSEMNENFMQCIDNGSLNVVRYPKGIEAEYDRSTFICDADNTMCISGSDDASVVIFTYGRITKNAYEAVRLLKDITDVKIVKLVKCYPLDEEKILALVKNARLVYLLEEGIKSGGIAEKIAASLSGKFSGKVVINAVDGTHAFHASVDQLYDHFGMTGEKIAKQISDNI